MKMQFCAYLLIHLDYRDWLDIYFSFSGKNLIKLSFNCIQISEALLDQF